MGLASSVENWVKPSPDRAYRPSAGSSSVTLFVRAWVGVFNTASTEIESVGPNAAAGPVRMISAGPAPWVTRKSVFLIVSEVAIGERETDSIRPLPTSNVNRKTSPGITCVAAARSRLVTVTRIAVISWRPVTSGETVTASAARRVGGVDAGWASITPLSERDRSNTKPAIRPGFVLV
jgi:hypothetical protein